MSCKEERLLAALVARLETVEGIETVELEPNDEHGDAGPFPSIAVLPGDVVPQGEFNRNHGKVVWPVAVRVLTQADPEIGNGTLPLTARTAAYALLALVMPALWPAAASEAYDDALDAKASRFAYAGHSIYPRDDGGKTCALYIETVIEYVLHLDNPDK